MNEHEPQPICLAEDLQEAESVMHSKAAMHNLYMHTWHATSTFMTYDIGLLVRYIAVAAVRLDSDLLAC